MVDDSVNKGAPEQGEEDRLAAGVEADNRDYSNDAGETESTPGTDSDVTESTPGADPAVEGNANTLEPKEATNVVNALELYDKTSQVSATVTAFPATIGNADHCDLALKGPGPEGVYARVRCERNVFIAQLANADIPFSVNERSLQSVILMDGDVLVLGDHEVRVQFTHVEPTQQEDMRRRSRRWRLMAGLGAAVFVLILIWLFSAMGGPDRSSQASTHNKQFGSASRPGRDRSDSAQQTQRGSASHVDRDAAAAASRPDNDRTDAVQQSQQEPASTAGRDVAAKISALAGSQPLVAELKQSQPQSVDTQRAVPSVPGRNQAGRVDSLAASMAETPDDNDLSSTGVLSDTGSVTEGVTKEGSSSPAAPKAAGNPDHGASHQSKSHAARARRRAVTSAVLQRVRESYAQDGANAAEKILRSAPSNVDTSQLDSASSALDRARRAYGRAQQAAADGNLDALADSRQALAHAEHTLGLDTTSRWLQKIGDHAVELYQRAAQRALDRDTKAQAYTWYQRTLAIRPGNAEAQAAVKQIVARARRWYLQGYKLEYQSLKSAMKCWRKVVNVLPPGTHWHQLAQAKLYEYRDYKAS